ncbi:MAG: dienelactone hydrolase family protein [bacterium]
MHKLFYILIPSCLIVAICAFVFYPVSNFPQPKGPYGVGQIKYHWVDGSRKELNAQDPEHPNRELMVYVYYPSAKSDAKNSYDFDVVESSIEFLSNASKLPKFVFSGIKFIKTYSQPDAPIAKSAMPFPVIIFSHGGGPVVQQYTYMLEEVASHGFIVVGINHPYVASAVRYPDGRIVKPISKEKMRDSNGKAELLECNIQDVSFVLNKIEELIAAKDILWSHADLSKVGVMGHSFGGRTATKVIRQDPRFKCGINMDGGAQNEDISEPFSKPFMFMIAEKSFLYNKNFPAYVTETKPFLDTIHLLADAKNSNTNVLTIKDIGHTVFIDTPLQLNVTLLMRLISRYNTGLLEPSANEASNILVNTIMPNIINFFDEQLKDKNLEN